ncbi:hypothetical protein Lalb_Chr12g0207781 [Lupinus albus]|uniref:Uncharacterized protein n=1 Tax=Lupinus albus TaxID=3870 RepID=A0A6A4PNJ9_LUPAL|nr:hypothetical protein Lalb_Chr12g0207781 [Lupinus albus]
MKIQWRSILLKKKMMQHKLILKSMLAGQVSPYIFLCGLSRIYLFNLKLK